MDFKSSRERMVEEQLVPRGINNRAVLDVFRRIERHEFVPKESVNSAYGDHPLPIGGGQTISQPYIAALMTESLQLTGEERVLEIGTGSGYQTAILAELSAEVYSVERITLLADTAAKILSKSGYKNIRIDVRDGSLGWPEHAPYDAIMLTASCPGKPEALLKQLAKGGRLIAPVGQVLTLYKDRNGSSVSSEICGCMFVPLIGKEGWNR
ncbi:MAG: protein-L-isoaspartate(D-aspartate) O-methyltransferase [Candidatus Omnitrophota bacterium]|nr:protein-L-isoaspartate(D-aspartate) O-methyltransferase [Candidatus Omnitrophota bacterium]